MGFMTGLGIFMVSFLVMVCVVIVTLCVSGYLWYSSDFNRFMHIFNFMMPMTKWGTLALFNIFYLAFGLVEN